MKRLVGILIALLMTGLSQASTNLKGYSPNRTTTVIRPQTATLSAPALVKSRIPKPKVFRSNPHRLSHFVDDPDTDIFVQDDDLATSYRRRDLNKIEHEDGISDKVRWKLFLARQLALLKYKQVHG